MPIQLTATYAAVLALLFVVLSVRTLLLRRKLSIGVGDGGDLSLIKAARAHANFSEYTPLCLILLFFLESSSGTPNTIHLYGVLLVVGRSIHAYGVSQVDENYKFRVAGMACTFVVLIGCSTRLLRLTLFG